MTEFATIPASAWNSVPAPMIVLCFLIVVLVMGFLPQIIRVITGKDRRAISVSNDLNQQAMNLMGGVAEELAKERVSHVQARRDADRGWWLARHWNGECWRLLGCWRNSAALVFSTRMALLVLIEKYNDVQSDSMKKIDVPEWARPCGRI